MPSPTHLHPLHSIPRMPALAPARPGEPRPPLRDERPTADDRRHPHEDEEASSIALPFSPLAALARCALARCALAHNGIPLAALVSLATLAPQLAHAAVPLSETASPATSPGATAPAASPASSSMPAIAPLAPPAASPASPSTSPLAPLAPPAASPASPASPSIPPLPASPSTPALDPLAPPLAPTPSPADLKAEADRLFRAGDLPGAATLWAQLAAQLAPGTDRYLLIWKALGAWERAFAADHDHRHLCAARDLALSVLRDHLRQDHRLEFELRLQALDRALADQSDAAALCIADTSALLATSPNTTPTPPPTPTPTPLTAAPLANSSSSPPPPIAAPAAPLAADAPLDHAPPPARPYLIAGAITLPLGLAALGLMTYGLLEDARAADDLRDFAHKNATTGLTPQEATAARRALARGQAGTDLAIGTGITAGALFITGVALLAHGSRLRARYLALRPVLTPALAGLTLTGSF